MMTFWLSLGPHSHLQAEFLRTVFEQYGQVAFVKYLREKGEGGPGLQPGGRPGPPAPLAAHHPLTGDPGGA